MTLGGGRFGQLMHTEHTEKEWPQSFDVKSYEFYLWLKKWSNDMFMVEFIGTRDISI